MVKYSSKILESEEEATTTTSKESEQRGCAEAQVTDLEKIDCSSRVAYCCAT